MLTVSSLPCLKMRLYAAVSGLNEVIWQGRIGLMISQYNAAARTYISYITPILILIVNDYSHEWLSGLGV